MYVESELLELKEKYSDTIIRDIVAFLNTDGGIIYLGITDSSVAIGLDKKDLDIIQKKLSDIITDQIEPEPRNEVSISLIKIDNKDIIKITISKGYSSIYCIKKYGYSQKGCLYRIGSTCKELSIEEIKYRYKNNLISENEPLLDAPSRYSPLTFNMLKILLESKGFHINLETFEQNFSLKRRDGHYNLMAELLSDKNMFPLIFVKFNGLTKASIAQRSDYGYQSIILSYQRLKDRLIAENICLTNTTVRPRVDEYLYDMDCVNEVLVNAIVHNDWTISDPLVSFFNDRLEILSHGGLPNNLSKENFFKGVSSPRNTILMTILLKLGIVEHTGHGVPLIIKKYSKDVFDIQPNYINVVIPFNKKVVNEINKTKILPKNEKEVADYNLSSNERKVLLELIEDSKIPYDVLVNKLAVSRRTISRIFENLVNKGYIKRIGNNKTGYWCVIK